ncbi:extracellular solute-binding protein family 1 [Thermobaculum terrenum ATCC BAA-798]|uniref:Extracellular solute-binding protein family 1 n=1 Tax=Thermobaculum terrenum (strain ATCC BAA-798 / CCMEE 7001 / YNP1) TaxID=525904 RepID=D1CGM3_THET1|nr:substrate-binding domain-containing protein [Thermobaculum terrenum]ACZ42894.1 extracellular solute-binding protein family 1 [Thermobaculum terrenum ATCC BAA-798]
MQDQHNTPKMTRRQILRMGAAAGLALTLGGTYGCARNASSSGVTIWTPLTVVGDNDPILQAIEKATGVQIKLQQIEGSVYGQRLNASIATGKIPDIMALQPAAPDLLEKWATEGVIAAFEGKVADAAPNVIKEYIEQPALAELKINGKIYQQPIFWGKGTYPNFGLIHVRKDLLDKYGMAPPDTFDELFKFLKAAIDRGEKGVLFNGSGGVNGLLSAFAGAYGIPYTGWVKVGDHWEYAAIQPQMKEALLLFRKMVVSGLVNPVSWSTGSGATTARDLYVSGQGAALIFNGGGHVGRIQNDMDLGGKGYKEWLLPAPTNNAGHRGYTSEPQYAGTTILGNLRGNNPVGAAKVINYLLSKRVSSSLY